MEGNYREENKEYRNLIREREEGGARVKKIIAMYIYTSFCHIILHCFIFPLLSPYGWMIKYFGN
jgi:hypothetical protein